MALNTEKTFTVSDDETGEEVILKQLKNGNFSIKVSSESGELRPDTYEEIGRRISEMTL